MAAKGSEADRLGRSDGDPAHGAHHDERGERRLVVDERSTCGQADAEPSGGGGDPHGRAATATQDRPLPRAEECAGDDAADQCGADTVDRPAT